MIDITTITHVNAHWIFTKNDERFKSTAENVRDVWEQAKIKHMMYSMVVNDLSPVRDDVLALEFLHKLDGIDISVDYLRALSDHYYKIEIQAYNVMRAL